MTSLRKLMLLAAAATAWTEPARGQEDSAVEAPVGAEVTGGSSEPRALSFEVGAGLEHDSNVALLELDTSTNAGDVVASLFFGLGYELPKSGRFGLTAGYDFSETRHEDFEDFDVRLQRASSTLSLDFGRVDAGAMLLYADAELAGEGYMTLTQISPYFSKLVGDRLFLRFAYADTDKDFAGNPLRAATAGAWSSDVYVFVNGLSTYLVIGLRGDDEDAVDPQFDYRADRLRLQLTRRFAARARELTFRAGVRSEARNYPNVTPSIGAPREDDRLQFEASLEFPLGARITTTLAYERADNDSNLPAVDFDEDVISLRFAAAF